MKSKLHSIAAFLAAVVVLTGCDGEEKLYDVSGTVTFGGKPVPKGAIHFDPDASKGGTGQAGFANILDGKYDTADMGKGVRGGAYIVRINAFDGKEAGEAPWGQALFPEHTEPHELQAAKQTLDISVKKK